MPLTKQEINRKLFHLFALLLPVGIFYFPKIFGISELMVTAIIAFLLTVIVAIETLRFRYPKIHEIFQTCFRSMLRKEEGETITGSTYFIGAALICSILFPKAPHISFMSLTMFLLGDAVAALVGLSIGRIKIGKKSLEGSLACFFLCVILCFGLFPYLPSLLDAWGGAVPLPLIFIVSLAITIFELIPLRIKNFTLNDNLYVPVVAGLVMRYLYPLLLK
ncbi:hypothetical protein QUF72_16165 [Desulfobacterales bacterium HSG2]|nr:hypothetical protein [Desulfobacterales bacterium HSG2]